MVWVEYVRQDLVPSHIMFQRTQPADNALSLLDLCFVLAFRGEGEDVYLVGEC